MIRPISPRRQKELAVYEKLKRSWRKSPQNQYCCVPGCTRPADRNPHHSRGRRHEMLNQVKHWRAICWPHHERIKRDIAWARALDLLPQKLGEYRG